MVCKEKYAKLLTIVVAIFTVFARVVAMATQVPAAAVTPVRHHAT